MEPELIRKMEEGDVGWAKNLDGILFPKSAWKERDMLEAFLPGRRFAVAQKGKRLGWAGMDARGAIALILSIDVEPGFQRRGVGTALLSYLISSARNMGKAKCALEAACSNAPALALYKKFGFNATGRIKGYYPSCDAFVMEKDLDLKHGFESFGNRV